MRNMVAALSVWSRCSPHVCVGLWTRPTVQQHGFKVIGHSKLPLDVRRYILSIYMCWDRLQRGPSNTIQVQGWYDNGWMHYREKRKKNVDIFHGYHWILHFIQICEQTGSALPQTLLVVSASLFSRSSPQGWNMVNSPQESGASWLQPGSSVYS